MPLTDMDHAGLGNGDSFPWVKKDDIQDQPVAIVQAWGFLAEKFQVCLLVRPLTDLYDEQGDQIPETVALSFDAEQPDNPRRRWLEHFSTPNPSPIGPVVLTKIEAKNPQGWVWAFRSCAMPAEAIEYADSMQHIPYRQTWKRAAIAEYKRRQAIQEAAKVAEATRAAATTSVAQNGHSDDSQGDLPF